jgi:hypothetical protein
LSWPQSQTPVNHFPLQTWPYSISQKAKKTTITVDLAAQNDYYKHSFTGNLIMKSIHDILDFTKVQLVSFNEIPARSQHQVEGHIFQDEEDDKMFFLLPGTNEYLDCTAPDLVFENKTGSLSFNNDLQAHNHVLPSDSMTLYLYLDNSIEDACFIRLVDSDKAEEINARIKKHFDTTTGF